MSIKNKSKSKTKESKNNSLTYLYVRNVLAFLKNHNLSPRIFPQNLTWITEIKSENPWEL